MRTTKLNFINLGPQSRIILLRALGILPERIQIFWRQYFMKYFPKYVQLSNATFIYQRDPPSTRKARLQCRFDKRVHPRYGFKGAINTLQLLH